MSQGPTVDFEIVAPGSFAAIAGATVGTTSAATGFSAARAFFFVRVCPWAAGARASAMQATPNQSEPSLFIFPPLAVVGRTLRERQRVAKPGVRSLNPGDRTMGEVGLEPT